MPRKKKLVVRVNHCNGVLRDRIENADTMTLNEMKKYLFNNLNKNLFLENIFMEFKNGFK